MRSGTLIGRSFRCWYEKDRINKVEIVFMGLMGGSILLAGLWLGLFFAAYYEQVLR